MDSYFCIALANSDQELKREMIRYFLSHGDLVDYAILSTKAYCNTIAQTGKSEDFDFINTVIRLFIDKANHDNSHSAERWS